MAAGLVLTGLAVVLLILLLQTLEPETEVWLHIFPAASPVDDATAIALSGGGWKPGEAVAICLLQPGDEACSDTEALAVETADEAGAVSTSVVAGQQLSQGQTTFIVYGLESGRRASRSFRTLKSPPASGSSGTVALDSDNASTSPTLTDSTSPPADNGWLGEYFANPLLEGPPVLTRQESDLAFNWGAGSPDPQLPVDGFSARWVRSLLSPGATYRFQTQADGGLRLLIDGQVVLDRWQDNGLGSFETTIYLTPGEHVLEVNYFDQQGDAAVALRWETLDYFPDWRGEYFDNPDLAGEPVIVRNDPDPDFDWGEDSPVPGIIPADGFSARWTRTLAFEPGVYRFLLTADDGARLLVDGQLVIDGWAGTPGETLTADQEMAGGTHQVVVELRDLAGPARIAVGWSPLLEATPQQVAGLPTDTPAPPDTPGPFPGVTASPTAASSGTVDPSATPGTPGAETTTPTVTPGTPGAETETPTATPGTPGAETETPTATPGTPGAATQTPTATPGTPDPSTSPTPQAIRRLIDINPIMGYAGTRITITSGNWTPGTQIRIALLEVDAPFSQAEDLNIAPFTTPSDSSQSFSISFQFPDDQRWLSQIFVRVLIHNADWSEYGEELFDVIPE